MGLYHLVSWAAIKWDLWIEKSYLPMFAASMIPKCIWQQILNCEISYISININNSMWSKISQPLTASSARRAVLNGCPLLHIDTCHSNLGNRSCYHARSDRGS